ncbi:FAD-linked oxidase [Aureimonas ureilytica]|uniref:FAD-linked oxidase n=1 Tax=Aureimonas ureilytica TaxID=401562 RepID=A0A175RM69_9HYPH|nr:FAD-binding oxidoreductase [Aureimonas ureilytica]KTR04895.1 FAD-linked oxidase [Aureimonas ureilytica]
MAETGDTWGRTIAAPAGGRERMPFAGRLGAGRAGETVLPYGNGRSYGDTCLNDSGWLVTSAAHPCIHGFDVSTGLLDADAGVLLCDVTRAVAPSGWFLPVTPGTQFVTLGGALANDVHGKNHHRRGTFGSWVESFDLVRSDGAKLHCSGTENESLFRATIGGLGLTGFVTRLRLRLMRVGSLSIAEITHRFDRLADYFEAAEEADTSHEYAVAWIDSLAAGGSFGRGHLICGDHAPAGDRTGIARAPIANVPFTPPISPLRGLGLRAFNEAYFRKAKAGVSQRTVPFDAFFYPLDRVGQWNRLYGPRGLHQHQSVVPLDGAHEYVRELMETALAHGQGSFLTVLKRFGASISPGLLSFPREGYTLTLDFPHLGERTERLLEALDAIVRRAGGRVNPYKDARMSAETFEASFPRWRELEALRDPAVVSDFWRRTALALPQLAQPAPTSERVC